MSDQRRRVDRRRSVQQRKPTQHVNADDLLKAQNLESNPEECVTTQSCQTTNEPAEISYDIEELNDSQTFECANQQTETSTIENEPISDATPLSRPSHQIRNKADRRRSLQTRKPTQHDIIVAKTTADQSDNDEGEGSVKTAQTEEPALNTKNTKSSKVGEKIPKLKIPSAQGTSSSKKKSASHFKRTDSSTPSSPNDKSRPRTPTRGAQPHSPISKQGTK